MDIEKAWALFSIISRMILKFLAVIYIAQALIVLIGGYSLLPVFGKETRYGLSHFILSIIFMVAAFLIVSIDKKFFKKFGNRN